MRTLTIIAAVVTTAVIGWLAVIATVLSAVIDNIAAVAVAVAVCAAFTVLRHTNTQPGGPPPVAPAHMPARRR